MPQPTLRFQNLQRKPIADFKMNLIKTYTTYLKNSLKTLTLLFIIAISFVFGCGNNVVARQGSVKGTVESVMGNKIEGAKVTWHGDDSCHSYTDELGNYYIDGVSFGLQAFKVERLGYNPTSFECRIYSGSTSEAAPVTMGSKSFEYLDIKVIAVSSSHAEISWKTTDYTYGMIQYGITDSLGSAVKESAPVYSTNHSVKLTNLSPEKTYYFRIVSSRENQPSETSTTHSFTTVSTLEDNYPPNAPAGVEVALNGKPGEVAVFWQKVFDEDLKGYKIFRGESKLGTFAQISDRLIPKGEEKYTDRSVEPGKKYYYRVVAIDEAGNESGYNAATEGLLVPGRIANDVYWTAANSPYVLKGDLVVTEFGHLHINSGVKLLVEGTDQINLGENPDKIELIVSGGLTMDDGAVNAVFAANKTNAKNDWWQGVFVNNSSTGAVKINNLTVSDAKEGIRIKNSENVLVNNITAINCQVGVKSSNSSDVRLGEIRTKRCAIGAELENNRDLKLEASTFISPTIGVKSENNKNINIAGCNFLDYSDTGLISEESVEAAKRSEFSNNLFVSSIGTGIKNRKHSPLISYNTFDSPYGIFVTSGRPTIEKNIFMARESVFAEGKICVEFRSPEGSLPTIGPNNVFDFTQANAYVGCEATADSTEVRVQLMKEYTGKAYDYRLREDHPDSDDPWGVKRDYLVDDRLD